MIQGADFIVFSDDWGRHPFSCMHLMNQFLPWNRILWVNTVGMRFPSFTVYDLKRSIEKIGSWFGKSTSKEEIPNNLTIISPVTIPFSTIKQVRLFNKRSVIWKVKKVMERLGFQNPILLTTLPNAVDYIGGFGEIFDVYYCVDEFSKWPGVLKDLVELMERDLIQKADLIVATSEELQKTKRKDSIPTHLLPHGVEINHFRKNQTLEPTPLIKNLKKPVIGYFGLFDERTDSDLIDYMAGHRPEWSFIFIGPKKVEAENLLKDKNVFFFPPVPYWELPRYLAGIDVFIIPYKLDELTKYINPLKLKECLAAGKPVVSTPLPEVLKLKEAVRIANTKEEFLEQISEALSKPFDQVAAEKLLETEDWSFKAEQMSQYIEEAIKRKGGIKG
jgi:glycosyltransferase involved in cell wall biosynthesis